MKKLLIYAAAMTLVGLLAGAAQAQQAQQAQLFCQDAKVMQRELRTGKYKEQIRSTAITSSGDTLIVTYANLDTGTWTVIGVKKVPAGNAPALAMFPSGSRACMLGAGDGYREIRAQPPEEDHTPS